MISNVKVPATMLDTFQNFLTGKWNVDEVELMARINRTNEFKETEAMFKGKAFHQITESGSSLENYRVKGENYVVEFWEFKKSLVDEISAIRKEFYCEKRVERMIETKFGPVMLYGYVDGIRRIVQDLKTTGNYYQLSYMDSLQWRVYLYCTGSEVFDYVITDFHNIYYEQYFWYDNIENELRSIVEKYIDFLNEHEDQLTNLAAITF